MARIDFNTPNVFGRYFTIDLGRNRAITRIRMRPGQTALNQPEYMRGYRVEAAMANEVDIWRLLAEERNNFNLLIDTQLDSTWRVMNKESLFQGLGSTCDLPLPDRTEVIGCVG